MIQEILDRLMKERRKRIDEWYLSFPDAHIIWKYRLQSKQTYKIEWKFYLACTEYTLFPARWRNAKKPVWKLTI